MMASAVVVPGDDAGIGRAADLIRDGELIGMPTETVYGLAGDATNDRAVARIFEVKNRPHFNPLIVHVPDFDIAGQYVQWNSDAGRLADRFWPGPLTIVLPRKPDCAVSRLASAGLDTVAMRSPAHPVARALLKRCGLPLAAPSANPAGRLSPTRASHVASMLGGCIPLILDGGPCSVGIESTVVDISDGEPRLLRAGGIAAGDIEATLGRKLATPGPGPARSPGMQLRHYAPSIPIRLNATRVAPDEALLAFGAPVPGGAAIVLNLSPRGDTTEAAANLFDMLHRLDDPKYSAIAVMPVPMQGLGIAINDRLRRATQTDDPPAVPD